MAGGRADTREYCRECGEPTLYSVYKKEPGLIIRRVVCKDCQARISSRNAITSGGVTLTKTA